MATLAFHIALRLLPVIAIIKTKKPYMICAVTAIRDGLEECDQIGDGVEINGRSSGLGHREQGEQAGPGSKPGLSDGSKGGLDRLSGGPAGTGERDAAQQMEADLPGAHQKTIGADKNYDTKGFVAEMRRIGVTPHVAQNTNRPGGSAIDGRTTRHKGYAQSINARRGIEKVFGWIKQWGGLRQFKLRGTEKVSAVFGLHVIAYNLIRLGNLLRPEAMEAA